jgi:DNA end-binding protein Ku
MVTLRAAKRRKSFAPKAKKPQSPDADHRTRGGGTRPLWSGTISFGLVSVPVNMYPATRDNAPRLRWLDESGQPVSRRYQVDDEDVDAEHLVRGYEVEEGEYVVVTDDELEALTPQKSRDIDLRLFVKRSEIPTYLLDRSYFLTPSGDATKAYRLLAAALERADRCGIATFVMRDKEYLAAIVSEQQVLLAQTMRFIDEVRQPADVGLPEVLDPDRRRMVDLKRKIKKLSAPQLSQEELEDQYAKRLRELVESKRQRGEVVVAENAAADADEERDAGDAPEIDLLDTIRLKLHKSQRSRRKTAPHERRRA